MEVGREVGRANRAENVRVLYKLGKARSAVYGSNGMVGCSPKYSLSHLRNLC